MSFSGCIRNAEKELRRCCKWWRARDHKKVDSIQFEYNFSLSDIPNTKPEKKHKIERTAHTANGNNSISK